MHTTYVDREEAGRLLAGRLGRYVRMPHVLVLALPRGGVPVAAEVAQALHAPLDVLVVRKLGLPADEEVAMGALGPGGYRVLNHALISAYAVPGGAIERVVVREHRELLRRVQAYRHGRPLPDVHRQTVILVDDGVATGATMLAAVGAMREAGAGRIVAAAPVMSRESYFELRTQVDELAVLQVPKEFRAVGEFYRHFELASDREVRALLAAPVA